MLKVASPMKRGVVIFRVFTEDREFGTHPKLFLGVIIPITVELSSPKLYAYKSKPGPLLYSKSTRLIPTSYEITGYSCT